MTNVIKAEVVENGHVPIVLLNFIWQMTWNVLIHLKKIRNEKRIGAIATHEMIRKKFQPCVISEKCQIITRHFPLLQKTILTELIRSKIQKKIHETRNSTTHQSLNFIENKSMFLERKLNRADWFPCILKWTTFLHNIYYTIFPF